MAGELRRNRHHLKPLPETSEAGNQEDNGVPDQASSRVKTSSPLQTCHLLPLGGPHEVVGR